MIEGDEVTYTYYKFEDIMLLADGTCSVDLSRGERCSKSIDSIYGEENFWGGFSAYSYEGYKDLDSMFNNVVTKNVEEYAYENTVA